MRKAKPGTKKVAAASEKIALRPSRDIMSPEKRSALMSRIRGKDTGPEKLMADMLLSLNVEYESHCSDLPGRPDFVFRQLKLAIFVDGDFWHGWRFSVWRHKLTGGWEQKIEQTRRRDARNHARLRRAGWTVVRFWEHSVKKNPTFCKLKLASLLIKKGRESPRKVIDRCEAQKKK